VDRNPLEVAICQELARVYLCTLDELIGLLPRFSSAQVASTVDRLIQEGAIACRSSDTSRSLLWLPPMRPGKRYSNGVPVNHHTETDGTKQVYEPTDVLEGASYTHNP
jgi:hypothetical protein